MRFEPDSLLLAMLQTLRRSLHCQAELSGAEVGTAATIAEFVSAYQPDELLTQLGGSGVAAVYEGLQPGPTVLVRCELDALPCDRSERRVAHLCGHDGHMTIVAGLAALLSRRRPAAGRCALLFQPAEETGEGALRVLADPRFTSLRPDFALGLHNLPGYPRGSVILRNGTFAASSVGMSIDLEGADAHAAEPDKAISPGLAVAQLLEGLPLVGQLEEQSAGLVTVTHAQLGQPSFGITPGAAQLYATLRAASESSLEALCTSRAHMVHEIALAQHLHVDIDWQERFPATHSDPELVALLRETCERLAVEVVNAEQPFRWSEDFGHYAQTAKTLYFGLGSGEGMPGIHQHDYWFPDEIVETGLVVFHELVERLCARGPST